MNILFKYPTKSRPEIFKDTLNLYYDLMSYKNNFQFLVSIDEDDDSMQTESMIKFLNNKKNLKYHIGGAKTKIEACNADMDKAGNDWDILVLVSDDMVPIIKGFDEIIINDMKKYFPDTFGALHYHDGLLGKDVTITLSIMGRKMYEYFGYIYHPSYKSFYCDNEFTDEVYNLNKVKYFENTIIKHEYKKHGTDALYDRNSKAWKHDNDNYTKRKNLNFPK